MSKLSNIIGLRIKFNKSDKSFIENFIYDFEAEFKIFFWERLSPKIILVIFPPDWKDEVMEWIKQRNGVTSIQVWGINTNPEGNEEKVVN